MKIGVIIGVVRCSNVIVPARKILRLSDLQRYDHEHYWNTNRTKVTLASKCRDVYRTFVHVGLTAQVKSKICSIFANLIVTISAQKRNLR